MKRLKQLLVIGLAAVMVFAFSACGGGSSDKTVTLTSISVNSSKAKTEYYVGDEFSSSGIVVTATYSDESTAEVSSSDYVVNSTAYDNTTAGTYAIVITYQEKTASYDVTVKNITVTSITLNTSSAQTEFYVGGDFSADGLVVTAKYNNGTTGTLTSDQYTVDSSAYDKTNAGTYTIKVTYGDQSASYTVTNIVPYATELSLDTSAIETEYYLSESYDLSGLTAVAIYVDGSTVDVAHADLIIDDSAIDIYTAGDYAVPVSYTDGDGTTVKANLIISILSHSEYPAGLYITKTTTEYTVSSSKGVDVDASDISVYLVENDVISETALDSGKYELTYYRIIDSSSVAVGNVEQIYSLSNLSEGKYEIWATMDYTIPNLKDADGNSYTYTITNCIEIYVFDTVQSISVKTNKGTFSQTVSTQDAISSTWQYTLTYASGNTETIYGTDANISVSGLVTTAAVDSATATVTYTKTLANGSTATVSCEVTYTIIASTGQTNTYALSISELVSAIETRKGTEVADSDQLYKTDFIGSNAFLTLLTEQSANKYRTNNDGVIEIKGEGLSVTFAGTGSITISFASTGSSNVSSIALIDSNGNYISGTIATTTATTEAVSTDKGYYYNVTGSGTYVTITFNVTTSGTYTIATNLDSSQNRAARIGSIVMTDIT